MTQSRSLLLAAVALVGLTSCGGSDLRKTRPVTGTVLVDGKPAAGAQVYLHPLFEERDRLPIHPLAIADDAGRFAVSTYNEADGAPEGEYVLTVEWKQRSGMSPHLGGPDFLDGQYANKDANKAKPEFKVTVGAGPVELPPFKLTQSAEAKRKAEDFKKRAGQPGQGGMMTGGK
ncbi:MAG: hypothetical protein U0871_07525 [Gemmataceae bacterium]